MLREIVICILAAGILLAGCVTNIPVIPVDKGTLELTSSPSGAEIYLDSQYKGTTPSTITGVEPGSHTLEYRMTGYSSWKSAVTVPSGTSNYYAALIPLPGTTSASAATPTSAAAATLTLKVSKDPMIIGESNVFSGGSSGTNTVLITVFGPGKYTNGIALVQQNVNTFGDWSATWNPGSALVQGTYAIVAEDGWKTISERREFRVIGGGIVSISPSTYAASPGQTITFSGQCTTGAQNVHLVLYGPERFSTGVDLGTISVAAGNTWSYRYKMDSGMPTGTYTISVSDVPKTGSGSAQFTVGFTS